MTYTDAYIERWGKVFQGSRTLRRLCTFEQFLVDPNYYIREIGGARQRAQLALQKRLDAAGREA